MNTIISKIDIKNIDKNEIKKQAELIKEGKSKEERFEILSKIAKYQLDILNNAEQIKLLGDKIGDDNNG